MDFSLAPRQQIALNRLIATLLALLTSLGALNFTGVGDGLYAAGEYLGVILLDSAVTPRGQALDLTGYETVLLDDFNGESLDASMWEHRGEGARSGGFISRNQVRVENGNLILKAQHYGADDPNAAYGEGWYSGMIRTVNEYTYGYFEMRCICSKGGGFWSAFWLNSTGMSSKEASQGGVGGAELDIFEAFNYDEPLYADSVSLNIHVDGYQETRSLHLGSYKATDIYNQYNTYSLEWTPDEYIFYINGIECDRSTFADGVSKAPEYVIVSLEPPKELTEQAGFETEFVIDYVKVMQKLV